MSKYETIEAGKWNIEIHAYKAKPESLLYEFEWTATDRESGHSLPTQKYREDAFKTADEAIEAARQHLQASFR